MNNPKIIPFYFQSNEIRTVTVKNEPWFVAKDICDVLDIRWNGSQTIEFLDDDERGVGFFPTPSGNQDLIIISESGLYTLIFRSNKPQAKPFRKWVTAEVLPAIRKTGSYNLPESDKKVFVNHSHTKVTRAPNGLDIRYTMDLGKIVANPTRQSIEMLERLTGIPLADISLVDSANSDLEILFLAFVEACCIVAEDKRVSSLLLYTAFREWLKKERKSPPPSVKRFSSVVGNHFDRIKSGRMHFLGLCLIGEQQ